MRYEGNLYWPGPTEASGYMLQVTIGCSHNKCTFCSFYKDKKFRVRPYEEIEEDIEMARVYYKHVPSVFLADGNVACLSMNRLRPILEKIKNTFPESAHTNMYARISDIARKSVEELKEMKELGVETLYCSLESGSDIVLRNIQKGYTSDEAVKGARHAEEAGIAYGSGVILGLGGVKNSEEHVRESIRIMNAMKAPNVGLTVLNPQVGTPLYQEILDGKFELPTYRQIFWEEAEILKGLEITKPTYVHSGSFLPGYNSVISCTLPTDKAYMLKKLEERKRMFAPILDKKLLLGGSL